MADRIQQRRDTFSRWQQYNPILLEGEVGYVTDNPNMYKIGDGEHAWNDLPLRGYTGTVLQSVGEDENSPMSQASVSRELNLRVPIKSVNTNRLPDNFSDYIEEGWLNSSGGMGYQSNYGHLSLYIPIFEGESLYTNFDAGGNPQIVLYDKDFNFLSSVPSLNRKADWVQGACYARFSVQLNALPSRPVVSSDSSLPKEYNPVYGYIPFSDIKNAGNTAEPVLFHMSQTAFENELQRIFSGSWTANTLLIYPSGTVDNSHDYAMSDFIPVNQQNEYWYKTDNTKNSIFVELALYDSNKNLIRYIQAGNSHGLTNGKMVKLSIPQEVSFIRYFLQTANINSQKYGLYQRIIRFANDKNRSTLDFAVDNKFLGVSSGVNLLNPNAMMKGLYLDSNGVLQSHASYGVCFVPISDGETLFANFTAGTNTQIGLFDINFIYINGSAVVSTNKQITNNVGAYYAAFSVELQAVGKYAVISRNNEQHYTPFVGITKEIENAKLLSEKVGINLYNMNSISPGWVNSSGAVIQQNKYFHTEMIPCIEGDIFKANFDAGGNPQIAVYNAAMVKIYSVASNVRNITIPAGGYWVMFSIGGINDSSDTSSYMIVKNRELPTEYVPYSPIGGYINEDKTTAEVPFYKNTFIRAAFNCKSQMTFVDTTFESGIFEDTSQNTYETSDYIPLSPNSEKNYYISWDNTMMNSFSLARFYDSNKKQIGKINGSGGSTGIVVGHVMYSLLPPNGAAYIRYANKKVRNDTGLFSAPNKSLEETVKQIINESGGGNRSVLWTGTSITAGATYPANSCKNLGATCINKAIGASFIRFDPTPVSNAQPGAAGLSLSASVAELETKFRPSVTAGTITEAQLNTWKQASYENVILPYLDTVNTIVIDHGYNDRYDLANVVAAGEDAVDWNSTDRNTFIGAFNYIVNLIWSRKPFMRIIVGGYFQNTWNGDGRNGEYVCTVLEWISKHYSMPLLDTWKYAEMGYVYVPNSSNYISEYNATYGTSYAKYNPDSNGNIMQYQLYCPDTVHPHSDATGNANKVLDRIFTKLLRDII